MQIDDSKFDPEAQQLIKLLQSDEWPEAVAPFLICNDTEDDKKERAEGILDYLELQLDGKKLLDMGCGEGHLVAKAAELGAQAVGFDMTKAGQLAWETDEQYLLTNDFAKVKNKGLFDVIILYDVLDHSQDPITILKQAHELCAPTGKVYARCHTWMSRHGGHLYRQINKAWVHLIFTPEELELMGIHQEYVHKVYYPINAQSEWFKAAGFQVQSNNLVRCTVEQFFRRPEIIKRLPLDKFKGEFPEWQMSQMFNDYVLAK